MPSLESEYGDRIIERGRSYTHNVNYCLKVKDFLYAEVEGSFTYKTKVDLKTLAGDCSCPYGSFCKHAVAAYLVFKNGDHINADTFLENLNTLNKRELIKIIIDNLHNNPDIALNYNLKKSTNFDSFVNDFIDDFSYSKLNKAKRLLSCFTFDQMIRILVFIRKNEDDIFDKIYEDYYDSYDEGDVLYDFLHDLKEETAKKITSERELKEAIKHSLHGEIVIDAPLFLKYTKIIKSKFDKENYLRFLLNLENPDLDEIKESTTKENIMNIYHLPRRNINLAEKIANHLGDKKLLFLVACYKKDYKSILKYFNQFNGILRLNTFLVEHLLSDIVKLFLKNKLYDPKIAKNMLRKDLLRHYNFSQVEYLLNQIEDYDYIREQLDFKKEFSQNLPLLQRLFKLDKKRTKEIIDKDKEMVKKWKIDKNLPTFIFLDKKGKEFLRLHGEPSKKELLKVINENKEK